MTSSDTLASHTRRHAIWAIAIVAAVLIAGAVAWNLAASRAYSRSFSASTTLADRAAAATFAQRLEPWRADFANRAAAMNGWLRGKLLLDAGNYNSAVDVLADAYRRDVGDRELLALFQKAQATQKLETNRKAHLQHGHEGPGGTLRPQDIER